ncbi:hypothetical protein SADUNF_Sadunf06G0209200 [Salix dunnii]|uniref:Trafficking protein particle complex II-specific subunit 120 homolog n=1 Tax=Salix dunnii TaxID=1413687 RepID=A0A835K2R5_9ROSI|nr:hypothetical protein SADUNF_Sadunf06G0209200 [Salix dunnii]
MEPDVSIETSSMIRIAILPIGEIPHQTLRDYYSMFHHHHPIPLSSISSFYTEEQKSPFTSLPWDTGSLRFKFILGGSPPGPWEDFQSNRKILAVIGVFHCPLSPDLDSVIEEFDVVCKGYASALVTRCFGFFPCDSQLEDGAKKGGDLRFFPPADRQTQEMHFQTMMQEIAASLLMEFEKYVFQAESSGTILKTPLDLQASLSSEEVIKAKKRRLGRVQKTIGDYCLLAGSPVDANAHYSTALELARLTTDYFWYAGALEGSICALLLCNYLSPFLSFYQIDQIGQNNPALEDEVRCRFNSVILHYKKSFIQENSQRVSPLSFELEANLKLARYLCRRELSKDIVELLTSAADGAKSLIDATDRLVLYVEIARLFGTLGYHRKAAFFSRQVAQLYLQQDNRLAAISALQVLALTTKAYCVQSRASISDNSHNNEVGSRNADSGKMHHQSVVSLFESQWSMLQMVVLREILLSAARAGDPLAAWSAAARLLRSYYPLITPVGQNGLARALANSSERLPSGTRCSDPALPFVRLYSFPQHSSQMDIVKRNPAREDWWAESAPSGPFIYTPFSEGQPNDSSKKELIWIVGEPVQILVELANPCGFNLNVDSIYLSVHSGNLDPFPISIDLPPHSSKVITLSGIPTSVGLVTIPGCTVHCFGVITEHLFRDVDNLLHGAAEGLVLSDPFRSCGSPRLKNISVPNISVVPPLPLLVSHVVGGDGAIILYEGEIRDIYISLANAGTVPVEQAHISLSGKNQDSVLSIPYETLKFVLPLKPGAEVILPVTLKAWKLGLVDLDNASGIMGRQLKDSSSPSLLIHYAGPFTNFEDPPKGSVVPPGRRLVVPLNICVLQGLSFVKAHLLSMEIPAHVGENLPKPVYVENSASKEANVSETKIDLFRGSRGLRFLELELSNPTDDVFEINLSVQLDSTDDKLSIGQDAADYGYPKTRIDRDNSARVLIPLEHFKSPILDGSFFMKDFKPDEAADSRNSSFSEKSVRAELKASVNNLISRIKVRWQSGWDSSGELNIKDAIKAALKTSAMDVLLPDPLTFDFRLVRNNLSHGSNDSRLKGSVLAHNMTPMEILVRNNTMEMIRMSLSITCKDVAGENCIEGTTATVLWSGVLNGIAIEAPPLQESKHSFSLYYLVPGDYTLVATAVIEDADDILRARAKTDSPDEPIFCRSPPFHVRVIGTA